ncbi:MAG TPA: zf-HC2 domain-containing protein [Ktedonobacteraceae bacterium]
MTKLNHQHLTTEQLSAFLDKQLSSEEQAIVDAHLSDCQQCQQVLADLRQTVVMLRALPKVEVPRSFTLPARIAAVQEQPVQSNAVVTPISQRRRARRNRLQGAIRAMSALAAVLGLIFILSSFAAALPHGGTTSSTSAGSVSTTSPASSGATTGNGSTPVQRPTTGAAPRAESPSVRSPQTPAATPSHIAPGAVKQGPGTSSGSPDQPGPAVLDLNGPTGHLVIGSVLFVLGILGFALARRR